MGIFTGFLLASDFDATLTDSKGNITERTADAVKYFISEGGLFTVCTGRTREGFHAYDRTLINAPVLLGNGAMGYDYETQRVSYTLTVEKRDLPVLEKITAEFPDMSVEIFSAFDGAFVYRPDDRAREHFSWLRFPFTEINSLSEIKFPVVKIMLSAGEKTFEVQDFLKSTDMGTLHYIPCTGAYVELISKETDKGRGLLLLAEALGISPEKTFAAGDGANDVAMLKAARTGFCPETGDPLAKEAADVIVCGMDCGPVADVIEYLKKTYCNRVSP